MIYSSVYLQASDSNAAYSRCIVTTRFNAVERLLSVSYHVAFSRTLPIDEDAHADAALNVYLVDEFLNRA